MSESAALTPRSEVTRRKIFETALTQFRENGFGQTSMRAIARAAGVATGLAYYYFGSKEAIVLEFYRVAQVDLQPVAREALAGAKGFEERLKAFILGKIRYFEPNRLFLGALFPHAADPNDPLSPFSRETQSIREQDFGYFRQLLEEEGLDHPDDLQPYVPELLWLYQMGLILFWIHDQSHEQVRTRRLLDTSVPLVSGLLRFAQLPLTGALRRKVIDLLDSVRSEGGERNLSVN